jgi:hypothetical protein
MRFCFVLTFIYYQIKNLSAGFVPKCSQSRLEKIKKLTNFPLDLNKTINSHLCMNGQDTVEFVVPNKNVRTSITSNADRFSRTAAALFRSRNDVAIRTSRQASLQILTQIGTLDVERNETSTSPTEGNLIVAVRPPVVDACATDDVTEVDHLVNLTPTVFAHPPVATQSVWVGRNEVASAVVRWSLITIVEVKRAHYPLDSVGMGQHKRRSHFVVLAELVGQHVTSAGSMAALIVVVVDKDERIL